jgi:hypothetical protein
MGDVDKVVPSLGDGEEGGEGGHGGEVQDAKDNLWRENGQGVGHGALDRHVSQSQCVVGKIWNWKVLWEFE